MDNKKVEYNIYKINIALIIVVAIGMINSIATILNIDTVAFNYTCYGIILLVLLYNTLRAVISGNDTVITNTVKMYFLTIMTVLNHVAEAMPIRVIITFIIGIVFIGYPIIQIVGNMYYLAYLLKKHADEMAIHMMLTCDSYIMLKSAPDGKGTTEIFNEQMDKACHDSFVETKKRLKEEYFQQLHSGMTLFSFDNEDIRETLSNFDRVCDTIYHNTVEVYEERRKERDES